MRKFMITGIASAGLLSLAACQSEQADTVEDNAEAQADSLEQMADEAPTEAQEKALDAQADSVEAQGKADAEKVDNGTMAPADAASAPPTEAPAAPKP